MYETRLWSGVGGQTVVIRIIFYYYYMTKDDF